ncbi:hypothetical protein BDF19DRAFT_336282, partial [Syncephalis fuscata]
RQEIRTLTEQQRQSLFGAIKKLQSGTQPNIYDEIVDEHNRASSYAHFSPIFLPWHRLFIHKFELELQKIDPAIMLPYWDWSYDSQAPESSIILSSDYFGGNGRENDQCLTTGQFFQYRPYYAQTNCIRRQYDLKNSINSFHSTEAVQRLITQTSNFVEFYQTLENVLHARVHIGLGGHMNTMHSVADPIFFMHHAMIDKIWATWQNVHGKQAKTFEG